MSLQSTLDRFRDIQIGRRELIWILIGAVAGVVLGLLIGWVFWPVDWQGGDISSLNREAQIAYVSTVADAYAANPTAGGLETARQRLAPLGEDLANLFNAAAESTRQSADGAAQASNLNALAMQLGLDGAGGSASLPTEQSQVEATGTPPSTSEAATDGGPNVLVRILIFLAGAAVVVFGGYVLWKLYQRGAFGGSSSASPSIGPLSSPSSTKEIVAEPISAYGSTRSAPPNYTAVQAAATKVQPVQPPTMTHVPPFEREEEPGTTTPASSRSTSQPIAPSVAVSPATSGGFMDDEPEEEFEDDASESVAPSAAVGQRPGAASLGWMAGAARIDRYQTIDRFEAKFTAGMEHFDWTHNIPGPQEGVYFGEYGIGISDRHGMLNNDPEQVVAIEVYIFDKSDEKHLVNISRVVLSEYADTHLRKHFEREKDRLGPIVAQPNTTLQLEARQFVLLCTITDVRYSQDGIFERLTIDMELKKKS